MSAPWAAIRTLLAVGGSGLLFARATMGFQAFTTDTARARTIATSPVPVPTTSLLDGYGRRPALADGKRVTIVQFFYTRCTSVCATTGDAFQRLQAAVKRRGLSSEIRLLSISFDPTWDTPDRLRSYARFLRPDTAIWSIATLQHPAQLPALLDLFGVRVIPDGRGGLIHNAAFHVVDRQGQLIAIEPIAEPPLDSRGRADVLSREAFDTAIEGALEVAVEAARRAPVRMASSASDDHE